MERSRGTPIIGLISTRPHWSHRHSANANEFTGGPSVPTTAPTNVNAEFNLSTIPMNPFWKVTGLVCPYFRAKRVRRFLDLYKPDRNCRILDLGGLPHFWSVPIEAQITLLNIRALDDYEIAYMPPNMTAVVGDGTRLPFNDQEFDIVFSNSVIEHVGTLENQRALAQEVHRVGRSHWVQTPAYEFPVEPHYFTPFVHWLPKRVQRPLLRNFTVWGLMGRPDRSAVDMTLAELRLLRRAEFRSMFPNSQIWTERFLGMPKSYTAYTLPAATAPKIEAAHPVEQVA